MTLFSFLAGCGVFFVSFLFARTDVCKVWVRPNRIYVFGFSPLVFPALVMITLFFCTGAWMTASKMLADKKSSAELLPTFCICLLFPLCALLLISRIVVPTQIDQQHSRVRWGSPFGLVAGWKQVESFKLYAPDNAAELRLSGVIDAKPFDIRLGSLSAKRLDRLLKKGHSS